MSDQREIRCPHCNKLLFKVRGTPDEIEIMCGRCSSLVIWPGSEPVLVKAKKILASPVYTSAGA